MNPLFRAFYFDLIKIQKIIEFTLITILTGCYQVIHIFVPTIDFWIHVIYVKFHPIAWFSSAILASKIIPFKYPKPNRKIRASTWNSSSRSRYSWFSYHFFTWFIQMPSSILRIWDKSSKFLSSIKSTKIFSKLCFTWEPFQRIYFSARDSRAKQFRCFNKFFNKFLIGAKSPSFTFHTGHNNIIEFKCQ